MYVIYLVFYISILESAIFNIFSSLFKSQILLVIIDCKSKYQSSKS